MTDDYYLGYYAYCIGQSENQNPHPIDDSRHREWLDGWETAREDCFA